MRLNILLGAPWLAVLCLCQTPPDYPPSTSKSLGVDYNGTQIKSGELLPFSHLTAVQPQLSTNATLSGTFMLLMMDLSIPDELLGGSVPSSKIYPGIERNHTTLVQWLQGNLTQAKSGSFVNSSAPLAPYLAVDPYPPGGIAHTYVFYLFRQPSNFTFPKVDAGRDLSGSSEKARIDFDIEALAGVVGPPVAANWMRVQAPKKGSGNSRGSQPSTTASANGAGASWSFNHYLLLSALFIAALHW